MNVFLSWSGERSRRVARCLYEHLPKILPNIELFLSDVGKKFGKLWPEELGKALSSADVGIAIVTPENCNSPWLHYEAGHLQDRLIPLLFDLPSEASGPVLKLLYHMEIKVEDHLFLLAKEINDRFAESEQCDESEIREAVTTHWPAIKGLLDSIPAAPEPPNQTVCIQRPRKVDPASRLTSLPDQLNGAARIRAIATLGKEFWIKGERLISQDADCTIILGDLDDASVKLWSQTYPFGEGEIAAWIMRSIGYFARLPNATVMFMNSYLPFSYLNTGDDKNGDLTVLSFHMHRGESSERPFISLRPDRHQDWYKVFEGQFALAEKEAKPFQIDGNAEIREVAGHCLLPLVTPGAGKFAIAINYEELRQWYGSDVASVPCIHGHRIHSEDELKSFPILPIVARDATEKDVRKVIKEIPKRRSGHPKTFNTDDLKPVIPFRWLTIKGSEDDQASNMSNISKLIYYPEIVAAIDGLTFRYPEAYFIGEMGSQQPESSARDDWGDRPERWVHVEKCHACQCEEFRLLHMVGLSRIVECSECGLHFQNPQSLVSAECCDRYAPKADLDNSRGMKSNLRASQYADIVAGDLQKMGKDICDGPILDVGCASGEFLNALATEYKVDPKNLHGIEPSRLAAKYARENHGCKVWDNFAEEVDWTKKPAAGDSHFKYVFLLNSLEHLYEPAKVLDGIHHALGRDGLLGVFTVPNVHSLAGRMFPLGFMAKNFLDAQDHFFFSLETLVKFMDYHGFQLCITEDMDNPFGRRRNIVAKDEVEKAARWLAFNCGVPRHELYGPDTLLPAWIERLDAMGADDREACDLTKGAIEGLKNHLADCVGDESLYESVVDFWRDNIWPQPDLSEACGAWFQPKVGQRSRS